jgi:hypothetical protein
MENDIFDWGELASEWWLQTAKEIGADVRHAKFAAAKHRNCSNTEAARLSGFGKGGAESTRSEGYRVSRSNKVTQLLALAAAEAGGGYDGTLSRQEARSILTAMARGSDPAIRIKSIEMLAKIEQSEGGTGVNTSKLDPADHLLIATLLCSKEGGYPSELFVANFALIAIPANGWWTPLLRQMIPYLQKHLLAVWSVARRHLTQRPDDLTALESGELLTADQIFEVAAQHTGLLLTVIGGGGDTEAAYRDLRRLGLIEPMPAVDPLPRPILATTTPTTEISTNA